MPVILATWEAEIRIVVQSQPGRAKQFAKPYLRNTQHTKKSLVGVAQVVDHLSRKHEALSSTSSTRGK
jgi:hypothetical protein